MRRPIWLLLVFVIILFTGAVSGAAQDNSVIVHTVARGENLFRIAQWYGTDVSTLAQLNGITNTWQIFPGQTLMIPTPGAVISASAPAAEVPAAASVATQTHVVRRGENLTYIAQLYGMSAEQLAALNNITNPNIIYSGMELVVNATGNQPAPVDVSPAVSVYAPLELPQGAPVGEIRHIVRPGEYLAGIAAQYGVSWLSIAQANSIYDPNTVYAGMELLIPGATTGMAQAAYIPAAPPAVVATGRSIIVDISDQRTYAYENGVLVRNVLSSTGLPATPTVLGDFTVERKYAAQTMSGPGYYLPDVPYVMYFYSGYALHGTYWHSNFGQPMSRGCVNLPTSEAEWFFAWADYGTPVHVQA